MVWIVSGDGEVAAIKELNTVSDRAAAIVGGTLLESRLEHALRRRFHENEQIHKTMFANSGPLGSFSAKNKLCFLIGLVGHEGWQDIDTIIRIRNAFAHDINASGFDTQSIKALCANLKLVERHCFPRGTDSDAPVSIKLYEEDLDHKLSAPRERYLLSVRFLCGALTPIYSNPEPKLLAPRF